MTEEEPLVERNDKSFRVGTCTERLRIKLITGQLADTWPCSEDAGHDGDHRARDPFGALLAEWATGGSATIGFNEGQPVEVPSG